MTVTIDTQSQPGAWAEALRFTPAALELQGDLDASLARRAAMRAANSARSKKSARTRAGKTSPGCDGPEKGGIGTFDRFHRLSRENAGCSPTRNRLLQQPKQPHGCNPAPSHPHN